MYNALPSSCDCGSKSWGHSVLTIEKGIKLLGEDISGKQKQLCKICEFSGEE